MTVKKKLSFLGKRLKNIYAVSNDIGDVLIASLVNPAAGIALAIKKIAKKVKLELEN